MKTLFTLAMASALSFSALAANEDLKELSTVNSNYKKINVTLKGGVGDAKISIIDQNGKNLNNRKVHVKDESVVVPYDMNNLPAGEYQVRITTEDEEVSYTVATMEKPIPVADLPLMAYGKAKDKNTINLSVIGLLEPGVEVKIISSESGKVIFEEKIDQPDAFKKDYKLKSLSTEDVYVELTDALGRTKTLFF